MSRAPRPPRRARRAHPGAASRLTRWAGPGALSLLLFFAAFGFAAANTVPTSKADEWATAVSANDKKPSWCAQAIGSIVAGTTGGAGNELILGTSAGEIFGAGDGNDCIHAGGGADTLDGAAGTDNCFGSSGVDTFLNCETTDGV